MSNVPNTALYAYKDGVIVTAANMNQDIQVLQTAINDNYARLFGKVTALNSDGSVNKQYNPLATAGIINNLQFQSSSTVQVVPTADSNGNFTFQLQVPSGALSTTQIANGAVGTAQIANGAVTATQIANQAITSAQIANNTITETQMAPNSIGSGEIMSGAIGNAHLSNNAVGTSNIASNAVTADKIADASVTQSKIANQAVGNSQLANQAVATANIQNGAITNAQLGTGAVGTSNIANGAVTGTLIAPSTITESNMASNSIGSTELQSGAVGTGHLQQGAVTGNRIANNTITESNMASNSIGSTELQYASVGTSHLQQGAVTGGKIANNTITESNMASKSVGTAELQDAAVTQTQLASGAVGSAQIQQGAVTSSHLASGAVSASVVTETRMGNAQSAFNDLNTRLQSAITAGSPSEIGDAHNSATTGATFATLKARLDVADQSGVLALQKAVNSGVVDYIGAIKTGFDNSSNALSNLGQIQANNSSSVNNSPNEVILTPFSSLVNGTKIQVQSATVGSPATLPSTGNVNAIQLDAPPASNVSPSLAGSARDDLVFLEAWRDATTSEWQWRIRVVDGVDFGTYPEGFPTGTYGANTSSGVATPQGALASPYDVASRWSTDNSVSFRPATTTYHPLANADTGLYIAGGNVNNYFNTADGYVYAIPLFRVRRRNSSAYDPDSNPLGGIQYLTATENGTTIYSGGVIQAGTSITLTMTSAVPSTYQVGKPLYRVNGPAYVGNITAVGTNTVTFTCIGFPGGLGMANQSYYVGSDRPDGLYSNIIDASDIVDLRHQVSLTGFNYQALLEKNLDLLLRGQLTTKDTARYGRDYIGVQKLTDDVNTLLLTNFDGASINGTANGAAVTGTTVNSYTPAYVNGVQGLALSLGTSTGQAVTYPVAMTQGTNTLEIELMFKPNWNFNDGAYHGMFSLHSSSSVSYSTMVMALYKTTQNNLYIAGTNLAGGYNLPAPLAANITSGTWHKVTISLNAGVLTLSLDGQQLTGTSITNGSLATAVTTACIGVDYAWGSVPLNGSMDSVRISNVTRIESQLPSTFSTAKGDRILDGPNSDFTTWSDDIGGTSGVNGRTNPYGLSRVPNQVAARVAYNGSEIRHYYGQGYTSGWAGVNPSTGSQPTGSFDASGEYMNVNANEATGGTTYTFTKPSNTQGIFVLDGSSISLTFKNNAPSTVSIDSNGTLTSTYSSSQGTVPSVYYTTASRHAHFIPSTKGFVIHDWTDDTITANGSYLAYATSNYDVTSVNHVRVNGAIQNGGYSVSGLNASSTITASAASGASSVTVANASGFVANQIVRISDGNGGWVTATINVVSSNTLTFQSGHYLSGAAPSGAIIQGSAVISFNTAPASGATLDFVYESVLTPSIGDYIRVKYQHTPYQGTFNTDKLSIIAVGYNKGFVTTKGTGVANSSPDGSWNDAYPAPSAQLPINGNDYTLKRDTITPTGATTSSKNSTYSGNEIAYEHSSSTSTPAGDLSIGNTLTLVSSYATTRGTSYVYLSDNTGVTKYPQVALRDLTTSVPHLSGIPVLAQDMTTGEVYLVVMTQISTGTTNEIRLVSPGAADAFKLQGRPLIKAYGGVSA